MLTFVAVVLGIALDHKTCVKELTRLMNNSFAKRDTLKTISHGMGLSAKVIFDVYSNAL